MLEKIKKVIKNPLYIFVFLNNRKVLILPDKLYLKIKYRAICNKKLDFNNVVTFNEKIQWLKLYDRKYEYTRLVDKYEVRQYIKEKIGEEYLIPLIGVYDKMDDIDFNKLPKQFVLKCTHDSGSAVICKDKTKLNIHKTKKKINKCLNTNYFYPGREWPYKNVKPRIIIEKYMEDENETEIKDYKFFCFNGIPKVTLVCSNRFKKLRKTFFDNEWNKLNFTEGGHDADENLKKPINFEKMKELAQKLAKDIRFVRIDFYEINGKIYFGEITFYPNSGYEKFSDEKYNELWGSWINLK